MRAADICRPRHKPAPQQRLMPSKTMPRMAATVGRVKTHLVAMGNASAGGGGGNAGAGGGGGGDGDPNDSESESDSDNMEEDNEEDPEEDPSSGQWAKEYRPKTDSGKAMENMFIHFCQLSCTNARTIVVYFGISSSNKLDDFQEAHWKDTFTQWQKRHPCHNGADRERVLLPP